ncbi:AEC family transporter [Leucothrix sargassi]|nr:AEC family transporter [Leucothrix sargassi]
MQQTLLSILPLFALIALGYFAKRTVLDIKMLPGLNQYVYYFAVPALLFTSTRKQAIDELLYAPGLLAFAIGCVITGAICCLVCYYYFQSRQPISLALRSLNVNFANVAYMGIPFSFTLLGESANAATIGIVLASNLFVVCGSQLLLEFFNSDSVSVRSMLSTLNRASLRNPVFMSIVFGIVVSVFQIELPSTIDTTFEMVAASTIPVALFCLGASFEIKRTETNLSEIGWVVLCKLFIQPAVMWGVFSAFGMQGEQWFIVAVLLHALPTGTLAHVLAMRYGAFEVQSSQIIVYSTVLSLVTLLFWTYVLGI